MGQSEVVTVDRWSFYTSGLQDRFTVRACMYMYISAYVCCAI